MVEKSSLFTTITSPQTIGANDYIKFDFDNVSTGASIIHFPSSSGVLLKNRGLYSIYVIVSINVVTTQPVTVSITSNNEVIASTVTQAVQGQPKQIEVNALLTELKSCECVNNQKTIGVKVDSAGTLENASLIIIKEA